MNFFPIELIQSAKIYCDSTIVAMKQMEQSNDGEFFLESIEYLAEQFASNNLEDAAYQQVVKFISDTAEKWVQEEGRSLTDVDGVCWMLGKLCKAYSRSLRKSICPFDKIFEDCFVYYFKNH